MSSDLKEWLEMPAPNLEHAGPAEMRRWLEVHLQHHREHEMPDWLRCGLKRVNLTGLDLTDANLRGSDLQESVYRDGRAARANFSWCRLGKARWFGVDCSGANFDHAVMRSTVFVSREFAPSTIRSADLLGANISGLSVPGQDLRGVKLHHVILMGANLDGACLEGCAIHYGNLIGASLRGAFCYRAEFLHTDLTLADLRGAKDLDLAGTIRDGALQDPPPQKGDTA